MAPQSRAGTIREGKRRRNALDGDTRRSLKGPGTGSWMARGFAIEQTLNPDPLLRCVRDPPEENSTDRGGAESAESRGGTNGIHRGDTEARRKHPASGSSSREELKLRRTICPFSASPRLRGRSAQLFVSALFQVRGRWQRSQRSTQPSPTWFGF